MTLPKVRNPKFACSCPNFEKDKNGKTVRATTKSKNELECEVVMKWALEYLSHKYNTVTAENFLTSFCYHMDGHYMANIDSISTDMWSGVSVSTYPRYRKQFHAYIQCDNVEDGLAFALRAFVEHFGEKNTGGLLSDEEWKAKNE